MGTVKPKNISDQQLMDLIESGIIILNDDLAITVKGKVNKAHLAGKSDHQRYYYSIRYLTKRRTIAKAKLVYMATHLMLVPDNCQIHHHDEDRFNDVPSNLIMLLNHDHDKIHGKYTTLTNEVPF